MWGPVQASGGLLGAAPAKAKAKSAEPAKSAAAEPAKVTKSEEPAKEHTFT